MTDFQHRKGQRTIRIVDVTGKPIPQQKIEIRQKKHQFLFGCGAFVIADGIFNVDAFKKDFFDQRTKLWLDLFNYGTVPFYWGNFEPEEGKPYTDRLKILSEYLKSKDVTMKGHPLCWHTVCADWLMKYDNPTILEKELGRIQREVSDFKGLIDMWDVINEVVIMPRFDKYDNAITRICNEYGQVGLVKKVFDEARKYNPKATLLINDFNTSPAYEHLIADCLDAGVEFSAIGIQSHQHQGYWGKEKTLDVLERFSKFGLPLHFSENTLVSGTLIPPEIEDLNDFQVEEWPSTPEGEARQCRELEEMFTTLFSHPLVEAITEWDFADGAWLNAPSGLIRKDNSVKPSYNMLKEKIKHEWFTTSAEFVTQADGVAVVEGFKGTYDVIVSGKTYEMTIDKNNDEFLIRLS